MMCMEIIRPNIMSATYGVCNGIISYATVPYTVKYCWFRYGEKIMCHYELPIKARLTRALYDIRVDVVTSEQCVVRECSDTKERTRQKPNTLQCINIVLRLDMGPGEFYGQQDRTANWETVFALKECSL